MIFIFNTKIINIGEIISVTKNNLGFCNVVITGTIQEIILEFTIEQLEIQLTCFDLIKQDIIDEKKYSLFNFKNVKLIINKNEKRRFNN